jgi:hypothetical protein
MTVTETQAIAVIWGSFLRGKSCVLPGEEYILHDIVWDTKLLAKYAAGFGGEEEKELSPTTKANIYTYQQALDSAVDKMSNEGSIEIAPGLGPDDQKIQPSRGGRTFRLTELGVKELVEWSRKQPTTTA